MAPQDHLLPSKIHHGLLVKAKEQVSVRLPLARVAAPPGGVGTTDLEPPTAEQGTPWTVSEKSK